VEQISVPTTIAVGERDLPDFHAIAAALSARIPGARKAVIPGAGHMSPIEAPDVFAALLGEHLARADASDG
jgi:pimeloyl-ACP methyl ester carboxylesterase